MAWTYEQLTGKLYNAGGEWIATGYSGIGPGLNNPVEQTIPDVGPIPAGRYEIGKAFTHPVCGPISMPLAPLAGTNTFGRSGFLIHGDTASANHTASHGCIIMPPRIRSQIDASIDKTLYVVATEIPGSLPR